MYEDTFVTAGNLSNRGNPVTRSTHTTNPSFTPRNSPTATPREAHVHANSKEFAY